MSNIYTQKPASKVENIEAKSQPPEAKSMYLVQRDKDNPFAIKISDGKRIFSFPYSYISMSLENNSNELEISFMGGNITIKGKNLEPVLDAINEHKLKYIRVANKNDLEEEYATFIDEITVERYNMR